MNRFTILVDAGYLMRQAVEILSGKTSNSRADLTLNDPKGLIQMLIAKASSALSNTQLLRVYWYDGVGASLTAEHKAIIALDDVQMRAGTINGKGQQKGVDSRIVTDMIELASNHAMCDAMLVTGDGDLAIGVELAQRRGVRVAVLGIEELTVGVYHSQSSEVTNIADRVIRIGKADIMPFLTYTQKPKASTPAVSNVKPVGVTVPTTAAPASSTQPAAMPSAATQSVSKPVAATTAATPALALTQTQIQAIESAVDSFVANPGTTLTKSTVSATGSIDGAVDKLLLFAVMTSLGGGRLSPQQKNCARSTFRKKATSFP